MDLKFKIIDIAFLEYQCDLYYIQEQIKNYKI